MDTLVAYLARHEFRELFVDALGWDNASGNAVASVDGYEYCFNIIAHKRGIQVLHSRADKYTLFNRRRLRVLQKQILRIAHEHIIVYSCDTPSKQVWQWAIHLPDGRRIRHREHTFFSSDPPENLLARLQGLRFTLHEEEDLTLVDAINRVRDALDTEADLNLFVNKPWYAEQSDKLAAAMQPGGLAAFKEFVAFHLPLAAWGAKRWKSYFEDMEDEDRVQIATIGLIEAAKRFDPSRGYQFSTYAYSWIRQTCERYGADCVYFVRMPLHALRHCRKIMYRLRYFRQRSDDEGEAEYIERIKIHEHKVAEYWRWYCRIKTVVSLSEPRDASYAESRQIMSENCDPIDILNAEDIAGIVRHAVDALPSDDAAIIRMRFGFDGEPRTLMEIGNCFHLTRERIRQRIFDGLKQLAPELSQLLDLPDPSDKYSASKDGDMTTTEIETLNGEVVSNTERLILCEIAAHPSGLSCLGLSGRLGLSCDVRKAALRTLLKRGSIVKDGIGRKTVYNIPQ